MYENSYISEFNKINSLYLNDEIKKEKNEKGSRKSIMNY